MILQLTEIEVREAVAAYINAKSLGIGEVKTDNVIFRFRTEGQYDEAEQVFDHVSVDLSSLAASPPKGR